MGHSLSPVLHRAAYAALGLTDWTYDALDIGAEDLPVLLAGLGEEWRGFSVTMPCKQAAVDAADVVEPLPRLLHAANTLVRTTAAGGRRTPTSPASAWRCSWPGSSRSSSAAVIGAGGTAAAAAVALASLGRSTSTSSSGTPRGPRTSSACSTPSTCRRRSPRSAEAALDAPWSSAPCRSTRSRRCCALPWRAGHTVLDVLYAPWPTPLAERVTAAGGTVAGGLEVLFWQATVQVELMTGLPAPIAAMRTALDAAVATR